ncbi:hypothetical protein [Pseudoalteromonas sp. 1_2015MBL_MicDiv]|uniref:hypothetical protein n=1 Tax=Pseudoalteromonas sp. 1_2015MBL_MicDiv TaxID=1720343 RepID=UPI000BBED6F2|nr:hypothetical protein [Pseudoalteromonas sp. 1_2015MBL_MicDiv]ATG79764.1 hypothetical protein AOR04_19685 [Pseudoalteromonas sp. 1_2015MBL_MicDiv]
MFRILKLVIIVFYFASFYSFAENIDDKAQLEKMVVKYESAVELSKECISSKMKNISSCKAFQKIYLFELKDSFAAFTTNLGSYIELDVGITLRGVAAITSASEAALDIYAHNKNIKTNNSQEQ